MSINSDTNISVGIYEKLFYIFKSAEHVEIFACNFLVNNYSNY